MDIELIAGERRLRAAQAADWRQVPVQIRDVDDRQMAELAIVENVQRKDLNAIEKAESFQRYIDQYHCTQEELAVARQHRPLDGRQPDSPAGAAAGREADGAGGRHLAGPCPGAVAAWATSRSKFAFAARIEMEGCRVRATEQAVQDRIHAMDGDGLRIVDATATRAPSPRPRNEQLASLEQELRTALGTKVDLNQTAKGRGKITIHFKNHEEFARLRQLLNCG